MAGPTTKEQLKSAAEQLRSEEKKELNAAAEDALTDAGNLEELRNIQREANEAEREPQRDKPGFFERILSFFSFNSKYKSGEMSTGKNKKRSNKSYEDFLIAKLSYQTGGESAYGAPIDGLTFSRSGNENLGSFSNDSAAIKQTRTDAGQDVAAETNVTYFDRVRLIKANANFKHRILGDSTAAYTSEKVQLKMLGEFRDLTLLDKSMTLLHNYTAGTDKFGVIASAHFNDRNSGVNVSTDPFFMRDGRGAPQLFFNNGAITLSTDDFTVKMTGLSSADGKSIISDKNTLSITGIDKITEIDSGISLTDNGIVIPEMHTKDGSPVLRMDENGQLSAGLLLEDENGEDFIKISSEDETPETENSSKEDNTDESSENDKGDTLKLGPVTFTGVKKAVKINDSLNVRLSAEGAAIDNVDFLELGKTSANLELSLNKPSKAVLESTSLIFKGLDFLDSVALSGNEITVDKNGVSFKEISLGAKDFDIGFLKAEKAAVTLAKNEKITVSASAENIAIAAKLGGLDLAAEDIAGKLTFPKGSAELNITRGSVSAGSDILKVKLSNIEYSDGKLDFKNAEATTKDISIFGMANLSNITAQSSAGAITSRGLDMGSSPELKLSADFSMLEKELGDLEFGLDNDCFSGAFTFKENTRLISSSLLDLTVSGKLGFKHPHASRKTMPVTDKFSASANLFGLLDLSADNIGIDSENKKFTADKMKGGIGSALKVTGENVKLGKDSYDFSKLTADYNRFELFDGVLAVEKGQITSESPEKFSGKVNADFNAGGVSANIKTDIEFTKEKGYFPAFTGVDEFSITAGDTKLEKASIDENDDKKSNAVDFSAEKLSIGKNDKFSMTNINGNASSGLLALKSADVSINDLFGIASLSGKIEDMTIDATGIYFNKFVLGNKEISVGDSLSAESAEISVSKTKQDGFSVTASINQLNSNVSFDPFSIRTDALCGKAVYKDGTITVDTNGDIVLGLADILSLSLTDLSYGSKTLSFNSVNAETLKNELFGGAVKLEGLTASAEKVSFSENGISADMDSGISVKANNISFLKASFGNLDASVTSDGFTADADAALGSEEEEIIPNVKASVSGKLSLNYSKKDKLTADMKNVSAFLSLFDNQLKAENITTTDNSLNIETINGQFSLPGFGDGTTVSMTGKNVSIDNGLKMDSLEAETSGSLTFFNDMLSISDVKFKSGDKFDSFTLGGKVGITVGSVTTSAAGTVLAKKENAKWTPKLEKLNDISLSVARIGSITANSIAPDEKNEKQLNITGINVKAYDPNGENATFLESIAGKNKIGVTLGLMKYYDGKLHPDMSTLKFETDEIEIPITDKIQGKLSFKDRSFQVDYGIKLPKTFDASKDEYFPKLISASIYMPVFTGVSVKGSAFAGAGLNSNISLSAKFGKLDDSSSASTDKIKDGKDITTFDLAGTAGLNAKAGGGVEASLVLGIPGLAQVEAGIRGAIVGSVNDSSLAGSIGINYDKNQKKFSVAKDGRTGASVKFNAGLDAKLSAFVGGKLLAVIDKDLCTFKICDINLANVDFEGKAQYTEKGWDFDTKGLKMSSDLSKLFEYKGITVDITKQNLKMGELNSLIGKVSDECAPLLGGRLGTEEAMESSAKYQAEIFPALKDLRKLADDSFTKLAEADRQYYTANNNAWENADAKELSAVEGDSIIKELDELNGADKGLNSIAKRIYKHRSDFANRKSYIVADSNGLVNTAEIRKHIENRPGFRSPAAILAALSKELYFNSSDKNAWIEEKMKRYINIRVAINSVFRNPVKNGDGTAALTTYNISLGELKRASQMQKIGISSSITDYNQTIDETKSDYAKLNRLNQKLMKILRDIDSETAKLQEETKGNEPKSSKKLENLTEEKNEVTNQISTLRRDVFDRSGKTRKTAIDNIFNMNEDLRLQREQLGEARDIYFHKDAKQNGSLLDISAFVNDDTDPNTPQRYNLSRIQPFLGSDYTVREKGQFVSKNEFRRAAWTALLHNADENENDLAEFLKNTKKFKKGEVRGNLSNQMLKMMYSNDSYSQITGTDVSNESHNVDLEKLREATMDQVKKIREGAGKQEEKMGSIEKLVFESNDIYIRAERLYLQLMQIQPDNFENKLSSKKSDPQLHIEKAPGYNTAINTLKENLELTKSGGMLSNESINKLKDTSKNIKG